MAIGSRPFGDPSGTETIVFRVAFCFAFEKKKRAPGVGGDIERR